VAKALIGDDIRIKVLKNNDSFGKRIREAKVQKTPYILVIGDEEMSTSTVTVESRDIGKVGAVKIDELQKCIKTEISNRKLKSEM